jgi:hypothetical protein
MVDEQRPTTRPEPVTEDAEGTPPEMLAANGHASLKGVDDATNGAAASGGVANESEPTDSQPERDEASATYLDAADVESLDAMEPEERESIGSAAETAAVALEPQPEVSVDAPARWDDENTGLVATLPDAPRPPPQYIREEPAWLPPEFAAQQERAVSPPLGRAPGRLPAAVLAVLLSGVFTMFLLIEPTPLWLALFGAIVAAIGTDGVLRSIRREVFDEEAGHDTLPHIFLPALFALTVPLFIEENLSSYWVIPAALLAGFVFISLVLAEVPAEDDEEDEFRGRARFVSVAGTYFVAFALFSLAYAFELGLREALIAIALGSVLLAVELLREGEIDPLETLLLACVVGLVVAEARWVLQFMPLDGYPAGLALLLTFYFVTGMVHAYMTRHINLTVAGEYSVVTAIGIALVIVVRATGVA